MQLVPEAMSGFKSRSFRRRLYLLVSLIIIGLQGLVYSAMIALWGARTLDHHLFSLSRLGAVSQVISVVSQALIIFSLAALTFFAQALASDQIVRRSAYFKIKRQFSLAQSSLRICRRPKTRCPTRSIRRMEGPRVIHCVNMAGASTRKQCPTSLAAHPLIFYSQLSLTNHRPSHHQRTIHKLDRPASP